MNTYDLIVLGGGPAGYCAAERAGAMGRSVLLIEKNALGGVCLNEGCIPSKTLLNSAKMLHYAKDGAAYGVSSDNAKADLAAIVARKDAIVKKLVSGVAAKMRKHGIKVVSAEGLIIGKDALGFAVRASDAEYRGAKLLIATGSAPSVPPIPGAREGVASGDIWLSRDALDAVNIPSRLCVIGGGVIGLEMAGYFAGMGSSVTVLEMLNQVGGPIDPSLSDALIKSYPAIDFRLGCKVTGIAPRLVSYESGGVAQSIETDRVLLCIGRRPYSEGLGLENVHVAAERGAILTDASGRTSAPEVYAAGDVNGRSMLAHTAYREAECAVATMFSAPQVVDYDAIPSVIYTSPEVACVGLTADQAAQRGYTPQAVTLPMAYAGRYLAETAGGEGFLTMVADKKSRRVLGVHMIGPYASEIIFGAGFMVSTRMPVEALRQLVFPHPTVSEILREALFEL